MENTIINTDIDETNTLSVLNEIQMLTTQRNKYNIHDIPPPTHFKRDDFDDTKAYKVAKDIYRESYKNTYNDINNKIKRLQKLNTELCIETRKEEDAIAFKNGTLYNPDEEHFLKNKAVLRKDSDARYYFANKEKIKKAALLKKLKKNIEVYKKMKKEEGLGHLYLTNEVIKPLCLCGKKCDVVNFKSLKKHSNIQKHQLFKSIIRLVHFKRQKQRLIKIVTTINNELIYFKKVVRVKKDGKTFTVTNKVESEIIKYYNDLVDDFDENKIQLRPSYIPKVNYTENYKDNVLLIKLRTINLKRAVC